MKSLKIDQNIKTQHSFDDQKNTNMKIIQVLEKIVDDDKKSSDNSSTLESSQINCKISSK